MFESNDIKIALLIDADNTSVKYLDYILNELNSIGTVVIRRAYGDWSNDTLKSYKEVLNQYSIIPNQQFAYSKGKNSTDGAMIIDAMDILYTKQIDCFCIATSDCDFTRLAQRLREEGKTVIGMGKQQTVPAFVKACSEFKFIDILSNEVDEISENSSITSKSNIELSILEYISNNDGETQLGPLKNYLKSTFIDFDERNYGYSKFSTFIKSFNSIKLHKNNRNYIVTLLVDEKSEIKKIDIYLKNMMTSSKKSHYTSAEIQNLIIKEFKNFKLKPLGFSTMKSFLNSFSGIELDDNKKYFYKEK